MKLLRKIKVRSNKIFAYFSLFSMLANTLSPFAAIIPAFAYAEDTTAPVEVVVEEKEPAEEPGIEAEAAGIVDAADGQDLAEEEISGNEITEEDGEEDGEALPEDDENSEEVVVDPEAPDILEDGVMDVNLVDEIEEVVEVEEIPTPVEEEVAPEVEQVCLEANQTVIDSTNDLWTIDDTDKISETNQKVQLGTKYIFPSDNKVSVVFKCLPKDETLRTTLKIQQVKTSDLNLPDNMGNVGEYAYDITTDMTNGTFEYEVTLPKASDSTAEVSYIEKSIDDAKNNEIKVDEIKPIEESKTEQSSDTIKAKEQDHFTIFVVTGVWPTTSNNSIVDGEGSSQIRWPSGSSTQSGLGFVGKSGLILEDLINGQEFILGDLTHYNHPVYSSIVWADLKITLGSPLSKDFTFKVQIDETTNTNNVGNCNSGFQITDTPCDDKVTFPNSISDQIVTIGGVEYTLIIDGFKRTVGGNTIASFITEEYKDNTASLVGHFVPIGRIIVDKVTDPAGDTQLFTFTTGGAGYKGFTLKDSDTPNSQVLPAGKTYSVNETIPAGWHQTSAICTSTIAGESPTISSLSLKAGETITCTFTNTKKTDVSITKTDSPDPVNNGGTLTYVLTAKNETTILAANVIVKDTLPTGFSITSVAPSTGTCSDITGPDIQCELGALAGNTSATVTIVGTVNTTSTTISNSATVSTTTPETSPTNNNDSEDTIVNQRGHIKVQKTTLPVGDLTVFTTKLTDINGGVLATGTISDSTDYTFDVDAGTYKIVEDVPSGWGETSNPCLNGVTVAAGETKTCVIENKKLPVLTIEKVLVEDSTSYTNFSFKVDGSIVIPFESDGNNQIYVVPGQIYNITETDPGPTYNVTYSAGCSGKLTYTESATCTITNTKYGSISGYKWNDLDGNIESVGDRSAVVGWTIELWQNANQLQTTTTDSNGKYEFTGLLPGDYQVKESISGNWFNVGNTSLNITLDAGENDQNNNFVNAQYATVTVYKNIDTDGDGNVDITHSTDWTWDITGKDNNQMGTTISILSPGSYIISEDEKDDYHVTSLICNNGIAPNQDYGAVTSQSFTLVSGQDLVCTFTNTRDTGNLKVRKIVDDGSDLINWSFNLDGGQFIQVDSEGYVNFGNIPTGFHSVTESGPNGYSLFSISGDCNENPNIDGQADITVDKNNNEICTFTNKINKGSITIIKDSIPNDPQDFSFTTTGNGLSNFSLDDDSDDTLSNTKVFSNLFPGTYSILEDSTAGWDKTSAVCSDGSTLDSIVISPGEVVTCTFTNTKLPTLTVNKILSPVGHGAFDLMIDSTVYASNVGNSGTTGAKIVSIGTHQISETSGNPHTNMSDYHVTYGGDCDPSGSITLAAGDNKTCTITNIAYGTIGITKDSLPNHEQNFSFITTENGITNFSLDDDSNATLSNVQYFYHLMPGQYGVTEIGVDGWELTGINCTDTSNTTADVATATASITLDPGESVYCTFTNTQLGKIIVEKQTLPDGTSGSFEFYSSWGETNFFLSDGQQKESWLIPGTYSFNEIVPSGWVLTDKICTSSIGDTETYGSLDLNSGETITCVFTNTKIAPPLYVSKFEDLNGNQTREDSERFLDGWTFELYENNTCSGTPSMTAVTNNNLGKPGTASFENLYLGQTYWIKEVEQNGWALTTGNCQGYTMHVDSNSNNQMYFGNQPDGTIHGYKWSDLDNSGTLNGEESLLSGWTINLYKSNGDGGFEPIDSTITSNGQEHFGWYWFENLIPGDYKVCEVIQPNWFQTFPINDDDNCHIISLPSGNSNGFALPRMLNAVDGPVYSFGNQELSTVTVYKFHDLNANGTHEENESYLSDWEINISKFETEGKNQMTGSDGKTVFSLLPDSYILSENIQDGWSQTGIYCEDNEDGILITSSGEAYGHHGNCEGWNGCGDAATCAQWACEINGYDRLVSYGDDRPCTQFGICHLFYNRGSIQWNWGNWCDVRGVTDISCSNGNGVVRQIADLVLEGDDYHDNVYNLRVNSGDNRACYIGNVEDSELRVSETNDSWPNTLEIGDTFTYTIEVRAINGPVKDVIMTNLPPEGIEPQAGTFNAVSSERGSLGSTGVAYASPGDWNLGNMKEDEIVTITYKAKVTENTDPGIYPDLSFAQGKGVGGSSVLAISEDSGFPVDGGVVDENFVGTQVKIAVESELETEVDVKEEEIGEVLGASTELPATGADTFWLNLLLAVASIGGLFLLIGGFGTMSTKKQKTVRKGKKAILGLVTLGFFTLFSFKVYAAPIVVRLSEPESPIGDEFDLVFVAMDIADNDMEATCEVKKPGSSSFITFGSLITISAGESGDSRTCAVTDFVLDDDGEYKFRVVVDPGDVSSNEVTVDYDGEGPDKPKYIEKEKVNNCVNKITLKTADDDETTFVQVFADDDKEIDIDDSHKIETESIGPDEKFEFEHIVTGDDCDKTWYYAVVAFDDAGNASNSRAEEITTTTTTTEEGEEETGAIPVEGGAGIVEGGATTGGEDTEGTEGEEGEGALEVDFGEGEEGSVLGEQTGEEGKVLFKSPWFWIVAAGLGIVIISAVKKSKKN